MLDYSILLWLAFWIALIDIVWFDSSAFEEYAELFGVDGYLKVKGFKKERERDLTLTYHNYLLLKHDNFFVRLVTCQLCTTIWLSIAACLWLSYDYNYSFFAYFPYLAILSYVIYGGVIKLNERY